jgi:hypothetical protein
MNEALAILFEDEWHVAPRVWVHLRIILVLVLVLRIVL